MTRAQENDLRLLEVASELRTPSMGGTGDSPCVPARLPGGFLSGLSLLALEHGEHEGCSPCPASLAGKVTDITSPALVCTGLPRAVHSGSATAALVRRCRSSLLPHKGTKQWNGRIETYKRF